MTKASAISLPWSCVEVSTKALTFAEAKAIRSVILPDAIILGKNDPAPTADFS